MASWIASPELRIAASSDFVNRARWLLISRRSLASSGEAESSISPPGSNFLLILSITPSSVGGIRSTTDHNAGANSFSGPIADRANIAWLQTRAISSIRLGSSVAFFIFNIATASDGSSSPLNDQVTCFSSFRLIVSEITCRAASSSKRSEYGRRSAKRPTPIGVCAPRLTSSSSRSYSSVSRE